MKFLREEEDTLTRNTMKEVSRIDFLNNHKKNPFKTVYTYDNINSKST
ncbi:MAG: hypothetical protein MK211_03710 [Flavobacteriales bacterium]|jgi:hypothetical protein|nr:hypothetical protein [Candidatus Ulvibacter alkanivorans]MCH2489234.1 hypothetical protein [Flavobacteriales bacterium]